MVRRLRSLGSSMLLSRAPHSMVRSFGLPPTAKVSILGVYHARRVNCFMRLDGSQNRDSVSVLPTHQIRNFNRRSDSITGFTGVQERPADEEEKKDESDEMPKNGYLPFPPPFHTFNIVAILLLANLTCYLVMNFCGSDDIRDFVVEHMTLSYGNAHLVYPFITQAFYQEHILQLLIDCWLLVQFGRTTMGFLGETRMMFFWAMCTVAGGLIHVGRQHFELYLGMDTLEVRGRCFGPNPFILGLVAMEGLVFRHLNFIQQPPVPFLVLTAFVMVIDVWRIFTTKPEEHGASTGGALVAYLFWALPTRFLGLDKLTAKM